MLTLKAHWIVWAIILLAVYMAFTAPATLGAVISLIGHFIVALAAGITHFLADLTSRS
jgi:hypothetical protein